MLMKKNKVGNTIDCLNNKGTTMVETLVAFVVLMIVLLALFKMVTFCSQLKMRSIDTSRVLQVFNQEIYRNNNVYEKVHRVKYVTDLSLREGKQGPLFYIVPAGSDDMNKRLWVTDINAYSFSYDENDTLIKEDKIMAPKAMVFVHKKDDN